MKHMVNQKEEQKSTGKKYLVSIIVPVYNTEKYIRDCIDSILSQTYPYFDVLLIDDGSQDGSGQICDQYAKIDNRIRVFHKDNSGVSSTRNFGIKEADGDYVLFCDSDDIVSPFWAEELFFTAQKFQNAFIACGVRKYNSDEKLFSIARNDISYKEISYFELYKTGLSAYSVNKIYDREKLLKLNLLFNETVSFSEDVEFTTKYCMSCDKIMLITQDLYYYRQISSSATGRYHPDLLTLHFLPFQCRIPLISKEDMKEYCSIWFYYFYHLLNNVFDNRNDSMSFLQKLHYNQAALSNEAFQFCLENADLRQEKSLIVFLMKKKKYYYLYFIQQAIRVKSMTRRRKVK